MRKEDADAGFTLLDSLMSMVVMTLVMAISTSGILAMHRTANRVDATSFAQTQISIALQRLDRQIRYAVGISQEYGSGQYVDFLTVQQGQRRCVQLRVAGGVLAQRTWTYQQSPPVLSAWTPLATNVTGSTPFTYVAPSATLGFQQLRVSLFVTANSGREANTAVFTAMNSSRTSGNDYCRAARTL